MKISFKDFKRDFSERGESIYAEPLRREDAQAAILLSSAFSNARCSEFNDALDLHGLLWPSFRRHI